MRLPWMGSLAIAAVGAIALVRCGIDGSLVCGDQCGDDASVLDSTVPDVNGGDVTPGGDATPGNDAGADVALNADASDASSASDGNDGGCPTCNGNACCAPATCNQNYCCHLTGDSCYQSSSCCSGLVCTGASQCATTCNDAGGSCSSNNDCCRHNRCGDAGKCTCNANGTACSQDSDCCNNNCNFVDGGKICQ